MSSLIPNEISDQQLISLIRQDDRNAFDQIYNRYWKKLFMYAGKVIKDEDEAQDIVQDVFLALWQRRKDVENIQSLPAYLHGAVRFKSLGYVRSNLNKHNYLSSLESFFAKGSDTVIEQINLKELNSVINKEIGKLPPKMREIFILSRIEHLSHKEIAARLKISDKTVKKQINRSLNIFRLIVNPKSLSTVTILSFLFHK